MEAVLTRSYGWRVRWDDRLLRRGIWGLKLDFGLLVLGICVL